jgi:tRNA dimethylallyltransferase
MLVVVLGATGTGKSSLSLDLAQALHSHGRGAEIVNADAMQLYRGMDIGTAKLSESDRRGIPHHLLDVLDVTEEASVSRYQEQARSTIVDILSRGAIPVLVGGSGLYVSSVVYDFRFPATDAAVRARLEGQLAEQGALSMHERLRLLDPDAAQSIGPRNGRRLVRALEVVELTGAPFGAGLPAHTATWMPTVLLGLRAPRQELVARLDERVRGMWRDGLVEEVRALLPLGIERGATAGRAIGYAQAIAQVLGRVGEDEAIAQTAALTRRYARRQVGWFRRDENTAWLDYDAPDRVERAVQLVLSDG